MAVNVVDRYVDNELERIIIEFFKYLFLISLLQVYHQEREPYQAGQSLSKDTLSGGQAVELPWMFA